MSKTKSRLLVIDGHSMAFRAFFALPADSFQTEAGLHTNAVYGFTTMLLKLLSDQQPTHLAIAFDLPGGTFRTREYPEYKAGRAETPPEFIGQVEAIQDLMAALSITCLTKEDYEADDILASLSAQAVDQGFDVLVVSGDRDAMQLVNDKVTVLYPTTGVSKLDVMTPQRVEEKYLVPPSLYPALAALVGEDADNLPGVPMWGKVTAARYLTRYGSLEELLKHAEDIGGKRGQSLVEHREVARRNRKLNRLVDDLRLGVSLNSLELASVDRQTLEPVLDALEFNTLKTRILKHLSARGLLRDATGRPLDEALGDAGAAPGGAQASRYQDVEPTYKSAAVDDEKALRAWLESAVALDVSGDDNPAGGRLDTITIVTREGEYLHRDVSEISPAEDAVLRQWLADEKAAKTIFNAKSAAHMLASVDAELAGVETDVLLTAYLRFPDARRLELSALAQRHLKVDVSAASDQGELSLDLGDQTPDGAIRAHVTWRLAQRFIPELHAFAGDQLLREVEQPVTALLIAMERAGIGVDQKILSELASDFSAAAEHAKKEAYQAIGNEVVNLNSPKQLQKVLFEDLGLPPTRKTKTGYSTDADSLASLRLRDTSGFIEALLAYRDVTKLGQTVAGLQRFTAEDGRIHTRFQQAIAATGRLSSTDPNLQNIPMRTAEGRRIRQAFVPGQGYQALLTVDYSQIEMRIMAHLSGDEALITAFREGEDLHRFVAGEVFAKPTDQVTGEERSRVKAVSYGLAYGLSA
ncbi:MAG: DNA polymerase I, partial [Bowdeniella nasicola]|nr:DNA polymerase I [Bowdeniella nasicola]